MPGNASGALLPEAVHNWPEGGRGHHLDHLRQHVVAVERLVQLHRVGLELCHEQVAARAALRLQRLLDHAAAAPGERQLHRHRQQPLDDALLLGAATGLEPGDDLAALVLVLQEVLQRAQLNLRALRRVRRVAGLHGVVACACGLLGLVIDLLLRDAREALHPDPHLRRLHGGVAERAQPCGRAAHDASRAAHDAGRAAHKDCLIEMGCHWRHHCGGRRLGKHIPWHRGGHVTLLRAALHRRR
mmetsp:Transcript_1585/g.1931  ORF Transcript_1585/g.1931 Transcript_1585/m.1931 type:complete len:243 (+) Transcript_1585:776-1504(+)